MAALENNLIESGQYQVGVLNYKVYDRRVASGRTDPGVVAVIWTTPTYADYNWMAHLDLEARFGSGFTDRLQQVLIGIEEPALLVALPRNCLTPARNEEFEGVQVVAKELGMVR